MPGTLEGWLVQRLAPVRSKNPIYMKSKDDGEGIRWTLTQRNRLVTIGMAPSKPT